LAGNIGHWPLAELAAASAEDWAVLEVSHTQLQLATRSPHVACVTNVTPNHLDQFTWEAYVDLKRNHVRYQRPDDIAVLNLDNPITRAFAADTAAQVLYFSQGGDLPDEGAFLRAETVVWRGRGQETSVLSVADIPLRGRHNVENVLAATAVAGAAGIPMAAVAAAVRAFRPVAHRLEPVGTVNGVTYVNDSIATAPERTLAGMRSFTEPLVLLLGGRDKHLPLEELAAECARRCRAVVTFGEAGPLFAAAVAAARVGERPTVCETRTLEEAVAAAARLAQPGDVVLLSPAGTSFDAYPNFEHRGEHFRRLVQALAAGSGAEDGA
jgi:UDP-N-acetylmuramoylalanine--D-glutamate ligase